MIIDEDVYLEHFGVKGMKWGVRKTPVRAGGAVGRQIQTVRGNEVKRNRPRHPGRASTKQRVIAGLKLGAGVVSIAALAAGAIYVSGAMAHNKNVRLRAIREANYAARRADYLRQQDLWKKARKVRFSQVHKAAIEVDKRGVARRIGSLPRTSPVDFRVNAKGIVEALHSQGR